MSSGSLGNRDTVIKRLGMLKTERASWWWTWQQLSMFLLPHNGRYFRQDRDKGNRRGLNIYDNTATRALRVLAAGLMGGLTSPARPWFRLGVANEALEKSHDVKVWLERCTDIMLAIFAKSNTYRMLQQVYLELGAFGTSVNVMGEDFDNVIHHWPITTGEYCIASNWKGTVDTMYREFQRPVAAIVDHFGIKNVSQETANLYNDGALDKWITIIHGIEPRTDRDPRKRDSLNMPWRSVYFELTGSPDRPLRESGYRHFPVLAPRWNLAGNDIYGSSPGMEALGDTRQLQQEQLRKSQGIDFQTNPPLQAPTKLKGNDLNRLPGGVTYSDNIAEAPVRTMFDVQLDLQYLLADIQDVRERINSTFYTDLFLMMSGNEDPKMTATEVTARNEEKMMILGPVLERLHNELLEPLISWTFSRMVEAGIVPQPPQELQGQQLNVELISVLAQAQRAIAVNGIDRFTSQMGTIAELKPEVLDNFDADAWAEIYSDRLGIDPELIVPSNKVAFVRKQRAQAQQQQAQAEQNAQNAQAMKNLSQVPTQGGQSNAAENLMNLYSGYNG